VFPLRTREAVATLTCAAEAISRSPALPFLGDKFFMRLEPNLTHKLFSESRSPNRVTEIDCIQQATTYRFGIAFLATGNIKKFFFHDKKINTNQVKYPECIEIPCNSQAMVELAAGGLVLVEILIFF
jgi:hypothetical protein